MGKVNSGWTFAMIMRMVCYLITSHRYLGNWFSARRRHAQIPAWVNKPLKENTKCSKSRVFKSIATFHFLKTSWKVKTKFIQINIIVISIWKIKCIWLLKSYSEIRTQCQNDATLVRCHHCRRYGLKILLKITPWHSELLKYYCQYKLILKVDKIYQNNFFHLHYSRTS